MKTYADVRAQLRSGDLLAWSHRPWRTIGDIKSQIVRMVTRSEYSHVGVCWVIAGRVFVIEAVKPKVRIYPLSKLSPFYWMPLGAVWAATTEEAALEHVGVDYSEMAAVQAFLGRLSSGSVAECAALVINVMTREGIDLGTRATPDAVVLAAQMLGVPTLLIAAPT
jgi:hypothetical protein